MEANTLNKFTKLAKDTENLIKELNKLISPIDGQTDLTGKKLLYYLSILDTHEKGSNSVLQKLIKDASIRLRLTYRKLQLKKLEKLKILKYDPFAEKYEFMISDLYEVYQSPEAPGNPSNWVYTKTNLNGKVQAITQTSGIKLRIKKKKNSYVKLL